METLKTAGSTLLGYNGPFALYALTHELFATCSLAAFPVSGPNPDLSCSG